MASSSKARCSSWSVDSSPRHLLGTTRLSPHHWAPKTAARRAATRSRTRGATSLIKVRKVCGSDGPANNQPHESCAATPLGLSLLITHTTCPKMDSSTLFAGDDLKW